MGRRKKVVKEDVFGVEDFFNIDEEEVAELETSDSEPLNEEIAVEEPKVEVRERIKLPNINFKIK